MLQTDRVCSNIRC